MNRFERLAPDGKFQVLVVGPIGAGHDKRSPWRRRLDRMQGRPEERFEDHLPNMEAAARRALMELGLRDDQFEVFNPLIQGGNIVENVFALIDDADFAIADISTDSPNVFYEIAFFNALGTPVVLLNLDGREIPFYWRQESVVFLPTYSVETIARELVKIWRGYFNADEPAQLSTNLITRFYGAPLVDISAASGVAVGFFENFARPVLTEGQGVLALGENQADRLLVIRPERINDHDSDLRAIEARLAGAQNRTLKAPAHKRGQVTARMLDRVIVDFPTPLYAMFRAPRYVKLRNRLRDAEHFAQRERAYARMEGKIIASYFRTLEWLIDGDPTLAKRRFTVVSLRDFGERGIEATGGP